MQRRCLTMFIDRHAWLLYMEPSSCDGFSKPGPGEPNFSSGLRLGSGNFLEEV